MKETQEVIEVDARGLYCPIPVLRLATALARCPPGGRARLLARQQQGSVLLFDVEKAVRSD